MRREVRRPPLPGTDAGLVSTLSKTGDPKGADAEISDVPVVAPKEYETVYRNCLVLLPLSSRLTVNPLLGWCNIGA